jgi:uncharacterized protein (DUF1697 family)
MRELQSMCEAAGLLKVRTYIASGNVIFESRASEQHVKKSLEKRLADYAGKPVAVLVRSAAELAAVLRSNPFPDAAPNQTVAIFLEHAPPRDTLSNIAGRSVEKISLGRREIYVQCGASMGQSKLKIAAASSGTARNMNTIARLAAMASD